ncbi:DUF4321 domain-containing protein [Clostridium bornimense]|uniref:DUF4321 domain-containing protein n=1 Tax=Clostridium bornimense TaxID=1216932 RepID=UPI001C1045F4|nr:DUF4321 domain-containing protein [Clostridium bornimense]MBU5317233.1 DUF4321 domain-containing protein [Clostridium bornimense]
MREIKKNKIGLLCLLIFMGAISGTLVGEILGSKFQVLSFMESTYSLGFSKPLYLDLGIIKLTFSLILDINIMTIIGIILVIVLYKRL